MGGGERKWPALLAALVLLAVGWRRRLALVNAAQRSPGRSLTVVAVLVAAFGVLRPFLRLSGQDSKIFESRGVDFLNTSMKDKYSTVERWKKPETPRANMRLTTERRNEEAAELRDAVHARAQREKAEVIASARQKLERLGATAAETTEQPGGRTATGAADYSLELIQAGRWLLTITTRASSSSNTVGTGGETRKLLIRRDRGEIWMRPYDEPNICSAVTAGGRNSAQQYSGDSGGESSASARRVRFNE